jgi:class 3 adenylate cyclase
MIPDEPVRGRTPPPWAGALSGIERCRAYSRGVLPATPMGRLLGCRTTHVAAGTVTVAMPASDANIAGNGQLEICGPMMASLEGACHTALPAGFTIVPLRFNLDPFRPAWPGRGNLLARARVASSSPLFVFAEVQLEDSDGRHIAQGTLHSAVLRIDPPPPGPPAVMEPVQEPVYETPDPYLRSFPVSPTAELMEREDGLSMMRQFRDGQISMPIASLYGVKLEEVEENRALLSIPASEWFCSFAPYVSCQAIGALANMAVFSGIVSLHKPGSTVTLLGSSTHFMRFVPADGRPISAEVTTSAPTPSLYLADVHVRNADGQPVARALASIGRIDASKRQRTQRKASRRILATLLFIDIVDSSGHAERLGDARWQGLLEDYRLKVRREISRFNGTEVDTAGDGFFVRFESPAYAIEAARAARAASNQLGIGLRAGVHAGECELEGGRLAGMAVHVAARVMGEAGPDEIIVSSTVKELAGGAGFSFSDRGEKQLKGVPDPWRLYGVTEV